MRCRYRFIYLVLAIALYTAPLLTQAKTAAVQQKKTNAVVLRELVTVVALQLKKDTTITKSAEVTSVSADNEAWWVGSDGRSYSVASVVGFTVNIPVSDFSSYPKPPSTAPLPRHLTKTAKKILRLHGFTVNARNSSRSETDTRFEDYVLAFTKKDIFCVIKQNYEISMPYQKEQDQTDWWFGCFDHAAYVRAYRKQAPFLDALGKGYDRDIVVHPRIVGNFAVVNLNARRGGAYAIMKKIDKRWLSIFEGQDLPDCDAMEKYNVPKSLYEECAHYQ